MRKITLLFCVLIAIAIASPVFAGGSDFAGPYAGLFAAHGRDKSPDWNSNLTDNDELSGWMGGVQAGYNWASNDWVYGVEADASFGSLDSNSTCANPSWECDIEIDRAYSLRGRLGRAFGNTLLYVTLGRGAARIEGKTTNTATGVDYPDRDTQNGNVYGIGVAHKFGMNASAWIDVIHYDLGEHEYQTDVPYDIEVEPTFVRAGINYQF